MAHRVAFLVEVEFEREEGQFASRDEMSACVQEALEGADPGSLYGDAGGQYSVTSWDVSEQEVPKPPRRRRVKAKPAQ